MRSWVKIVCGVAIAAALSSTVAAQTTAPLPVTPQKLALAQQVVDASGSRRNSEAVMRTMFQSMAASMSTSLGAADDKAFLTNLMQDEFTKLSAKVMANSAQIYAQTFTDKELGELLTFYQSPTGRMFVDKTPDLVRQTNVVTAPLIAPMQRDILDRVFTYVCTKQKCTPEQLKRIEDAKARALAPVSRPSAQPIGSPPK